MTEFLSQRRERETDRRRRTIRWVDKQWLPLIQLTFLSLSENAYAIQKNTHVSAMFFNGLNTSDSKTHTLPQTTEGVGSFRKQGLWQVVRS